MLGAMGIKAGTGGKVAAVRGMEAGTSETMGAEDDAMGSSTRLIVGTTTGETD
jgi:hypothetical protein